MGEQQKLLHKSYSWYSLTPNVELCELDRVDFTLVSLKQHSLHMGWGCSSSGQLQCYYFLVSHSLSLPVCLWLSPATADSKCYFAVSSRSIRELEKGDADCWECPGDWVVPDTPHYWGWRGLALPPPARLQGNPCCCRDDLQALGNAAPLDLAAIAVGVSMQILN